LKNCCIIQRLKIYINNNRIVEAGQELTKVIQDQEMARINVLILANKQDVPGALSIDEIKEKMKLESIKDREWCIFPCCAVTGEGLEDGLNWLEMHCGGGGKRKNSKK